MTDISVSLGFWLLGFIPDMHMYAWYGFNVATNRCILQKYFARNIW